MIVYTDPLLKRQIFSQAKRYESLDDLIVDYEELINEQRFNRLEANKSHFL